MTDLLTDAAYLARLAGAVIRDGYESESQIENKGDVDLVTDTDLAAEKIIIDYLTSHYSDSPILAEESGTRSGTGNIRWIVDPLDGTVNFTHRIPHFCVLVAAQERLADGEFKTTASATYDPMRDEMFLAKLSGGATLNGHAIQVSEKCSLIESLLTTGFGYERLYQRQDNHAEFCRMNLVSRGVRRLGSAGLDLAYVAAGRFDGFWEYALNCWDQAAGLLLVSEAGGKVSTLAGEPATIHSASVAVAGPGLHEEMLRALASAQDYPLNSRQGLASMLPPEMAVRVKASGLA